MTNILRREPYQVDILIRGWGGLELTKRCIQSILDTTDMNRVHITYVDNGSSRDELLDLMKFYQLSQVQYVSLPFNHGSVRAINVGLSLAMMSESAYVLLLDNDTEIPEGDRGWLDRFLASFEDETVACAGATSSYTSLYQHIERVPNLYQKAFTDEAGNEHISTPPNFPLLVSFAMMLRKSAVEQVGLFDEQYEPGNCEDFDYTLSLCDAGYKCVIASSVYIKHVGSQTFSKFDFEGLLSTNYSKLVEKWGVEKLASMGVNVQ